MSSPVSSESTVAQNPSAVVVDGATIPTILDQAATPTAGPSPDRRTVAAALLAQEHQTKRGGWNLALNDLIGTWRLRFTAPKQSVHRSGQPSSKGYYIPGLAQATLSITPDSERPAGLTIQNQLNILGLKLRFTGPAKMLPHKNLLAFDFERMQVMLGRFTVLSMPVRGGRTQGQDFEVTPIGKLPFFSFFAASGHYLAARGRGGGLALWVKQS